MSRRIRGWDEEDVFTKWRHRFCYLAKPGVKARVKRRARRRDRREARQKIHQADFWDEFDEFFRPSEDDGCSG